MSVPAATAPPPRREATLTEALIPLIAVAVFLTVGYGLMGINVEVLLVAAAVVAGVIARRIGYSYGEMQEGINTIIYKSMTALLIVTVVGAMIAAWIACGTIPMLIYYGLKTISPTYFLVSSCIVCSIVSLITGTSWGTVGTIGVALMGVAAGLGVAPAPAAGAIVAGAYFGDKLSFFSDTTNLAPVAARTNIYDHVIHMFWTTAPAFLIGIGVYFFVGLRSDGMKTGSDFAMLSEGLTTHFHITGWYVLPLLLPPVITLGAALLRKPVIPSMLISCAVAWLLAISLQTGAPVPHPHIPSERAAELEGKSFGQLAGEGSWSLAKDKAQLASWNVVHPLYAMVRGYEMHTGVKPVDTLLSRGGMMSMMDTLLIALAAFAFAGVMSASKMLETLLNALLKFATTTGKLVMSTAGSCILVALCTGSSYLSILLPGELFAKAYRERNLAAKNLSRTTEDCGTVIVPLVPWSVAGVYMAGILDVPVASYAPWAIMCYLGVIFAVVYGFTGFKIAPRRLDDESQPGS